MKTTLLALNLVFIAIIVMLACQPKDVQQAVKGGTDCGRTCDYHTGEITGEISTDAILKLSAAYAADARKRMITETKDTDALSLVFDIDKVKNFMWQIESAACIANCRKNVKLGLRFYYIKYDKAQIQAIDDQELTAAVGDNYWKHSLAMVPVYYDVQDAAWYDFDYRTVDPKDRCRLKPPSGGNKPGLGILPSADNHGGIGPPPYPGVFPTIKH
jgi:hypothetical protein